MAEITAKLVGELRELTGMGSPAHQVRQQGFQAGWSYRC
jgi:hypothetical protein